jgi:hypothetical protein
MLSRPPSTPRSLNRYAWSSVGVGEALGSDGEAEAVDEASGDADAAALPDPL